MQDDNQPQPVTNAPVNEQPSAPLAPGPQAQSQAAPAANPQPVQPMPQSPSAPVMQNNPNPINPVPNSQVNPATTPHKKDNSLFSIILGPIIAVVGLAIFLLGSLIGLLFVFLGILVLVTGIVQRNRAHKNA